MPDAIEVIINAGSGSVTGADTLSELERAFEANGLNVVFRQALSGDQILQFARAAAEGDATIVVAAGGDGTVSAVASSLVNTDKTLGILPLGTLNNFSKDLLIPQDIRGAVDVVANNFTQEIDVGEVNGHYFINNSSIGLYPRIVRKRVLQQQRLGRGKWWAAAWATWRFLWFSPFLRVRLRLNGREFLRKTPFLFVGNNDYEMDFYNIGRRMRLDQGNLSIYLLHRSGRKGLFLLVLRTLFGRLRQAGDFEEVRATDLTVAIRRRRMLVAADGEVRIMRPPLSYKIHPRSLRVIVPERE